MAFTYSSPLFTPAASILCPMNLVSLTARNDICCSFSQNSTFFNWGSIWSRRAACYSLFASLMMMSSNYMLMTCTSASVVFIVRWKIASAADNKKKHVFNFLQAFVVLMLLRCPNPLL